MFDWLKVKSTLESALNECKKMRATMEKNKLRIEELRKLPLPKEELIELVSKWMDDSGSDYPQLLQAELNKFVSNPMDSPQKYSYQNGPARLVENLGTPLRVLQATVHSNMQPTTKTIERALFYMLGDQLKAGVRRAIQEMEYPTIVGPTMPRRLAEIDKLTKENSELQAQIEEIEAGINDFGVVQAAVESQKEARKKPINPPTPV
ncbi:MAG: hypothetical protein J0H48_01410 [Nitrosospira multiformis]|nr:hypothetical protein [Nitrosospira multiformis]